MIYYALVIGLRVIAPFDTKEAAEKRAKELELGYYEIVPVETPYDSEPSP